MRASACFTLCVAFALLGPSPGAAQRLVSHDTLSGDSPVAVSCGFCAGERFGVIFRELPAPARALDAMDFPLVLNEIRIAVASARVTGTPGAYTCGGSTMGGSVPMDLAVYAGTTVPSAIRTLSELDPWPGEIEVYAGSAPLTVSTAESEGSMRYEVNFNRLMVADEAGLPVRIDAPNVYLRIVVTLGDGTDESQSCLDMGLVPPSAIPVRDDDGVIEPERAFIYATGVGWLWNEEARVDGDWGLRIEVTAEDGSDTDAGPGGSDAGRADAGPREGGVSFVDAGPGGEGGGGGCGCRTVGAHRTSVPWAAGMLLAMLVVTRRFR